LRVVHFENIKQVEKQAWALGYLWMDYVTSWNDPKIENLENQSWLIDHKSVVPWLLNPKIEGCFSNISFLSEKPLNPNFIVQRSYSDHGRIGSLN